MGDLTKGIRRWGTRQLVFENLNARLCGGAHHNELKEMTGLSDESQNIVSLGLQFNFKSA